MLFSRLNNGLVRRGRELSSVSSLLKNKSLFRDVGYINGQWTNMGCVDKFDVFNPANGALIAQVPRMTADSAEEASQVAFKAWGTWKTRTCKERAKVLTKMAHLMAEHSDDLAILITLESGKPFAEAKGEIAYALGFYEFFAEEAKRMRGDVIPHPVSGRRLLALKEPCGPAALITPWNFPSAMITRKMGAALAAGCTVVIKPSEETPLSALALCALAEMAGVPAGVVNCLTVGREEVVQVGAQLCHSDYIRKVSFTGSTAVGKWLLKESSVGVKRVSMELGGNAPFIVFEDADIDVAVRALMAAKFRNAGQACIAANRILVQRPIMDRFTEALSKKVNGLKTGDGMTPGISMGPLINSKGLSKVADQVNSCISNGASLVMGGSEAESLNAAGGTFYLPTILTNVTTSMAPFREETFGPLAPLCAFDTEEEALLIANDTPFGLAAYACTKDLARAWRVSEGIETGMVGINEGGISSEMAPFGGVKESGLGREGSYQGVDEYTEVKYVCLGLGDK